MKEKKYGFTLVEIIIVVAVIGVLAAILIPNFSKITEKANRKSAYSDAKNSVEMYISQFTDKDSATLVGDNSVIVVRKGEKDWSFVYKDGGVKEVDTTQSDSNVSIPKYGIVAISKNDSIYAQDAALYDTTGEKTVYPASFPKNVIMYNSSNKALSDDTINCLTFTSDKEFHLVFFTSYFDGEMEYSFDKVVWTQVDAHGDEPFELPASETVYVCGKGNTRLASDFFTATTLHCKFDGDGADVKCSGNVMSLLDGRDTPTEIKEENCFSQLFLGNEYIVNSPELPSTVLTKLCYHMMFAYCSNLKNAPILPATDLEESCYYAMFTYCTALTDAPDLPAQNLAFSCYSSMFKGTAISDAPHLPAKTLMTGCYASMFADCDFLSTPPIIDAVITDDNAEDINGMFARCDKLSLSLDEGTEFVKLSGNVDNLGKTMFDTSWTFKDTGNTATVRYN